MQPGDEPAAVVIVTKVRGPRPPSVRGGCARAHLALPSDRGDRQHDTDDLEGIAEAHDQSLALDGVAERNDRLVLGQRPMMLE